MKKIVVLLFILFVYTTGSKLFAQETKKIEQAKTEVMAAEKAFCQMAKDKGIEAAFLYFAAEDAVISRSAKLYKGKAQIKEYYKNADKTDQLSWVPEYVSVALSADLGYTYGKYQFSGVRNGNTVTDTGYFHTTWHIQKDGSWRFVFD